jgi:hypothetical protein
MKSKTNKIIGCVFVIILLIITLYFLISDYATKKDSFDFTQYTSQENSVEITTGEPLSPSKTPQIIPS